MTPPAKTTAVQKDFDGKLIKAMSHPLRFQALHILNSAVASPTEMARELRVPTNKLAYHVRILEQFDCVELVKTRQVRGATEHFYRATRRVEFDPEEWAQIPKNFQDEIIAKWAAVTGTEISAAIQADTFTAGHHKQIWITAQLDERGAREAADRVGRVEAEVREIEAASLARQIKSGEEVTSIGVLLCAFQTAPPDKG